MQVQTDSATPAEHEQIEGKNPRKRAASKASPEDCTRDRKGKKGNQGTKPKSGEKDEKKQECKAKEKSVQCRKKGDGTTKSERHSEET